MSSSIFFESNNIKIFNDDVITTKVIEDSSIDLIVTSPPYNLEIEYNSYNDNLNYSEYLKFSKNWMNRCFEWLKNDGRFCLNIPFNKNKGEKNCISADITNIAKQIGFKYHTTVIWNKANISKRTAWGSWMSASAPVIIPQVEVIIVLYKECWKKTSGSRKSDIEKDEFIQ